MTAKPAKITRADLDTAILLRESITDFILADALDGTYRESEWTQMHAAFAVANLPALRELVADLKRDTVFIEPSAILKTLTRKQREDLTGDSYTRLIRETPGTRLFARSILDANISETPFS